MDSLTQIVLGASVGEVVLGKRLGNKALFYGGIAGTIPDLDVLFGKLTDTITATEWHRGISHSIIFCAVMAPLLGWIVNKIEQKSNLGWKPWAKLFFWGLITHPILDAFTSWGTQLFWPFTTRIAFNSIFVIDPLYTVPFLLCTLLAMFYRRESKIRRRLNTTGLIVSTTYLFLALFIKSVATSKFEQALQKQGITYTEISTRPSALNTILWNANIDTPDSYLMGEYSFFDRQPIHFIKYPKNRTISIGLNDFSEVQRLIAISKGWYIIENKDDKWYFNDLRFGTIPKKDGSSFFVFSYLLENKNGKLYATEVPKTDRDAKFLMKRLWERIKGN
ncbi:metal-dependent hydrolase [Tenacibaculum holothuriorum]|uniref:Metal-dependent hydrolase n=1 Tax=Tenacibaculum holothuriorum TaxID=1635173 RepID=A0A1Y2PGY7_9FLAO|nr:metal-dependent hydrolase [Tenacibaculum holothuriorum]OSY89261.1 metal-dependent hydrolase [Tenacibaculum holothuriorum]